MLTNSEIEEFLRGVIIRRIKRKDFSQLFELMGKAFRKETVITGLDAQRLSRVAKLYRLIDLLFPVFDVFHKDFETILVAVSRDRLIGAIHLSPHGKKIWSLNSSAVDTMFRRRGVYRNLLKEALRYISKKHGEKAVTSLLTTNVPAVKMTNRLKFEVFETQVLLRFEQGEIPTVEFDEGISIREFKPTDVEQIYQVCEVLNPRKMQIYKMAPVDFIDSLFSRIMSRIAWSYSKKWVMEMQGKIVGYAHATYTSPQEAGKIQSFYVLPSNRSSKLKGVLLGDVLRLLAARNIKKVTTSLNEEWRETIEIFERFGFKPVASLYGMVKELV